MSYETITLSVSDGIAKLTLNRPDVLNALNGQMLLDLKAALAEVAENKDARALLITGAGRGFCAGADLAASGDGAVADNEPKYDTHGDRVAANMYEHHNKMIMQIWEMPKPVVTAINGVAAGGGVGLALTSDVTIAARSASFVSVFGPKLGIVPDMGTTFHLQRLVGRARAMGMAMLGDKIPAEQAADWGLVFQTVDDDQLEETAMAAARRLADGPPLVFPRIREAFAHAEGATMGEQLTWEAEAQRILCSTEDFGEGVAAFLQKRAPAFQGK